MTPHAWLVLFCVYVAVMYSGMRSLMEETKSEKTPGLPAHISFIMASLWPLIALFFVSLDVFKGLKELVGVKKTRK
jgi:hypothetical protein